MVFDEFGFEVLHRTFAGNSSDCRTLPEMAKALLDAAETDLAGHGAKSLLGSSVPGGAWEAAYCSRGYQPLTLYLARCGLRPPRDQDDVRAAGEPDIDAIIALSATNRARLFDLDPFWKPHDDADERFGAWMQKSLTLKDRDMLVSEADGRVTGYAISQPATPLHFPPAHDIAATGVIDDYYHEDFADPVNLTGDGTGAARLLRAAEMALTARGNTAALVVCPAAWTSKIAVLEAEGYRTALTWFIKR